MFVFDFVRFLWAHADVIAVFEFAVVGLVWLFTAVYN